MAGYRALYHPFIHFKDDGWLKLAALYWDRMGRIVPDGYQTEDSQTVRALGHFVEAVRPKVSEEFTDTLVRFVGKNGPALRKHYNIKHRENWPEIPDEDKPPPQGGPSGVDPRLAYIFDLKMSPALGTALVESKLAMRDHPTSPWIGMHPQIANVYMTALADQLAGERGLSPVAAVTTHHLAMSGLTVERLAQTLLQRPTLLKKRDPAAAKRSRREIEAHAGSIALQAVLPRDLANVDVEKILAFRDKYPGELGSFQQLVEKFVNSNKWLTEIKDQRALSDQLKTDYRKTFKPKLDELKEKLHEVRIDTIYGCFNTKVLLPKALPTAALATLEPISATVAGCAWVTIPILRANRKKMEKALRSADVSYLYRVEEELTPRNMAGRIMRGARRFLFGI
jgi:hypothetical protein